MFGESESESPRTSSPWDRVLASSPAGEKVQYSKNASTMPRLSAEVEEGNVEYKLHLIQPSPARFARLVTQLKWRLLEGGGQAFYELGVADSGALVGLNPDDLADTLTTLRAMAADIGARVVITKEIEVVGMGFREEDAREFAKKRRDRDREKDKAISKARAKEQWRNGSPASFEPSSLSSVLTVDDEDERDVPTPALDSSLSTSPSPAIAAVATPNDVPDMSISTELDDPLALFTMDDDLAAFTRSDDIIPVRIAGSALCDLKSHSPATATVMLPSSTVPIPVPSFRSLTKAEKRRITRDLRRAERKKALEHQVLGGGVMASELSPPEVIVEQVDLSTAVDQLADRLSTLDVASSVPASPRMIVEAMVIRDLDVEEAFLDFARM